MDNKTNKKINRKIKLTRIESPVIGALLKIAMVVFIFAMQVLLFRLVFYYAIYSKTAASMSDIWTLKASYEQYGNQALVATGRRYVIYDADKKRIAGNYNGEEPKESSASAPFGIGKTIRVYALDESMVEDADAESIDFKYWLRFDTTDGGYVLSEYVVAIDKVDVFALGIILLVLGLLVIVLSILAIVGVILEFKNHNQTVDLVFGDDITGGKNKLWFDAKAARILKKRKLAETDFAIVNILLVKYGNFCVCHSAIEGERVLKSVYNTIVASLESDEICARNDAANFVLLMKAGDDESLRVRIGKLIDNLEHIYSVHKFSFHAGIKRIDRGSNIEREYNYAWSACSLLENSDDSGINFFDEKLLEETMWVDKVAERQQYALDHEEFVVYYQPKYDPKTEQLKGAEALVRWQSDIYGFVSPGRIIPIFEKNGFITEIDHYMLRHVARDQKRFADLGYSIVPVSVNVSRAHFMEDDLAEQIKAIVDEEGADRSFIEIELTESAFFDNKKAMIDTIEKLRSYGFSVSMDDFGSGYSSLNSLKDMPLDVLKLDAEFFRGETAGDRREIVVSEAIRLAKGLNMKTVAEGVEVKEQVDFLAELGCDMIQGYYFAKPMPVEEYEKRLSRGRDK